MRALFGVTLGLLAVSALVILLAFDHMNRTPCSTPHRTSIMTFKPTPSPILQTPDDCHQFEHTEMGGGIVVGGGSLLKVDNASACCAACMAHNVAQPRPRGRVNCTTWVFNVDPLHSQARECWLKRHTDVWADVTLLAGGSKSWTTGIVHVDPPTRFLGGKIAPTARSCGDDRWRRPDSNAPLYPRAAQRGVHTEEFSFCPAVQATEADFALELGVASGGGGGGDGGSRSGTIRRIRIRLNRATCPKATAWIDSLLDAGTCANRSRCMPHCCNFYRAEAALGVHTVPNSFLLAHQIDPARPPSWGKGFYWGPPYAFIQGRLWHGGPGPTWKASDTQLPSEGSLPTLHRGTVELVGGGPDFLIALADHPMMPPHNVKLPSGHAPIPSFPTER